MEIPSGQLLVRAGDEVYNIGPPDEFGKITIIREGARFPFTDCRIKSFGQGEKLIFIYGCERLQVSLPIESITVVRAQDIMFFI